MGSKSGLTFHFIAAAPRFDELEQRARFGGNQASREAGRPSRSRRLVGARRVRSGRRRGASSHADRGRLARARFLDGVGRAADASDRPLWQPDTDLTLHGTQGRPSSGWITLHVGRYRRDTSEHPTYEITCRFPSESCRFPRKDRPLEPTRLSLPRSGAPEAVLYIATSGPTCRKQRLAGRCGDTSNLSAPKISINAPRHPFHVTPWQEPGAKRKDVHKRSLRPIRRISEKEQFLNEP